MVECKHGCKKFLSEFSVSHIYMYGILTWNIIIMEWLLSARLCKQQETMYSNHNKYH